MLPLIARARARGDRPALLGADGTATYAELLDASARIARALLAGAADLHEARICYHVPPGVAHVAVQWGIWRAGGVAVPLAASHPPPELDYVIRDAEAAVVVAHPGAAPTLRPLAHTAGARFVTTAELLDAASAPLPDDHTLPDLLEARRALMVYTSGTTGRPKGVVTTHANLRAQITSLIAAWGWRDDDRVLLVLPLHHVHGIVNVVLCALWAGAACELHARFDATATWTRVGAGGLTVFMAVPTVYRKLIATWDEAPEAARDQWAAGCRAMRLMVSGSAALPVLTLERWRAITGHTLLERYGMTEIGMALSNPLGGTRRPGFVGTPLPGVEARLMDGAVAATDGAPGEIQIRGPGVFLEYWRRPEATLEAFTDGWFRTGDTAVIEDGAWRILGRTSVDILNPGGYKVSALEIEAVLRGHPAIAECAVVGVDDAERGETVCVAIEADQAAPPLTLRSLQAWANERLAPYKVPRALIFVEALPRNAMGKVVKPDVARLFAAPNVARPAQP